MAGTLFGREVSGTPLETRAGTTQISSELLGGGGGRLAASSRGALGFDPGAIGIEALVGRLLTDPRDRLSGLFAALEPFEQRQTEESVAGLRSGLGRLGSRFGRSAMDAESRLRSDLASGFAQSREQSIIEAEGMQSQMLAQLFQALLGSRGQTLSFFQPGAPNFQEGFLGDLIEAGGNIAAARVGA